MALITLAQAKRHLYVDDDAHNTDILLKVDQASAIILNYLKSQADPTWTDATVPGPVQAATLLMLTHLYEERGDNMASNAALWEAVANLCRRFRDPALA